MRKFLGALVVAVMMAASLVAFSGSPAQAACPYTGCIRTSTHATAPAKVHKGDRARVKVRVTARGNAHPKGRVMIKITRRGGGYSFVDVAPYSGGTLTFKSGHLKKKGKYIVTVFFKKNPGSRWLSSSDGTSFRVKRR